jgi:hypothetical protein
VVTSITITSPGNNYLSPTVAITGGGGSGALAEAEIDEDAALSQLIQGVSAAILNEADVEHFYSTSITELRNGNGKDRLTLAVKPVTGVSSVTIILGGSSELVPQSTNGLRGWLFDDTTLYLREMFFPTGVKNIQIVYTAGEGQGSPDAVNAERACIATCDLMWKMRPHAHERSESAPQGMGVSTSYLVTDFPPIAKSFIDNLRRKREVWYL